MERAESQTTIEWVEESKGVCVRAFLSSVWQQTGVAVYAGRDAHLITACAMM